LLTERSIINFLIWVGGLIIGPYLVVQLVEQNFAPAMLSAALLLLLISFTLFRNWLWFFPLGASYFSGKLNFLPFQLTPSDISMIVFIAYFLVAYVALLHRPIKPGPAIFSVPIFVIAAILLYHEHSFGLQAFGSSMQGSRPAVFALLAALVYLFGINIPVPPATVLAKVPLYALCVVSVSAVPFTISTIVPSLAPYLWYLTDNINVSAYTASLNAEGVVREQGQAGVGFSVMVYLLTRYPLFTWWRPGRWWLIVLGIYCTWLVLGGGFRSAFVVYIVAVLVGTACYSSWRTLVLIPTALLVGLSLSVGQSSHLINLPLTAQRSLSFIPGDWDPEVKDSAVSSNAFRDNIRRVYKEEYMSKSPLIGNGFAYNAAEFSKWNDLAVHNGDVDGYNVAKAFITGKEFHIGCEHALGFGAHDLWSRRGSKIASFSA